MTPLTPARLTPAVPAPRDRIPVTYRCNRFRGCHPPAFSFPATIAPRFRRTAHRERVLWYGAPCPWQCGMCRGFLHSSHYSRNRELLQLRPRVLICQRRNPKQGLRSVRRKGIRLLRSHRNSWHTQILSFHNYLENHFHIASPHLSRPRRRWSQSQKTKSSSSCFY